MNKYSSFFQTKIVQAVSAALTICIVFSVLFFTSRGYFQEQHERFVAPWQKADSIRQADLQSNISLLQNQAKAQTLWAQYSQIENYKSHHLMAATTFYRNYYSIITTLTVCSVLLAVFVFLLLKKGWDNEPVYPLKSFFLTTSVLTTVLYGYLQVYDLETNIAKNIEKYFIYEKMQIDIHSACYAAVYFKPVLKTKPQPGLQLLPVVAATLGFNNHREINVDSVILTVNSSLAGSRGLMINFSVDKIPKLLEQADKFEN
ncbi:MAG: hypothetical protein SFV22_08810 [Saprospiraceae bacterium]|nr:hypothetical protein [Saprospiraceae bacterium]